MKGSIALLGIRSVCGSGLTGIRKQTSGRPESHTSENRRSTRRLLHKVRISRVDGCQFVAVGLGNQERTIGNTGGDAVPNAQNV